jgi:hypothetical protein
LGRLLNSALSSWLPLTKDLQNIIKYIGKGVKEVSAEWNFESVPEEQQKRLVELGKVDSRTLAQMGVSRVVSPHGDKIDPEKEQLVISGAAVYCGVCASKFALPDAEIKLGLEGFFREGSDYYCKCPHCNSQKKITGHTIEVADGSQEYWVIIERTTYPSHLPPPQGWPLFVVDKVSVEPRQ